MPETPKNSAPSESDKLSQIQEYLTQLQKDSTFTIKMDGGDTVLGQLSKISDALVDSLSLKQYVTDVQSLSSNLDKLKSQMASTFGVTKEDVGKIQQTIAISYKDILDMGGDIDDIAKIQDNITKTFNTGIIASKDNVEELYAVNKVTNVAFDKLIGGFREVGYSMSHIENEMQKVSDVSYKMGVNTQEVSKRVMDNLKQMNLYNFQGGIEGLAKMAAQSAQLGINMQTTFNLGEKLLDPQNAIDMSASLQRLGVTSSELLDPLRAMDLAQNDPTELQNQLVELSKQFVKVKEDGSFEILPGAQRQMREIETVLGLNRGELAQMGKASADLEMKMSKIRFPEGLNATDEQKKTIASLSQFNDKTGKYEISLGLDESGKEIKQAIDDLPTGDKDLQNILDKATKGPPKMEELAKGQLSALQEIIKEGLKIKYAGRVETAMAQGDVITRGTTALVKSQTDKFDTDETRKQDLERYVAQQKNAEEKRQKLNEGKTLSLKDISDIMTNMGETYIETNRKNIGAVIETLGKDIGGIGNFGGVNMADFGEKMEKLGDNIKSLNLKDLFENTLVQSLIKGMKGGFKVMDSEDSLIDIRNNVVHRFDKGDITAFIQKDNIVGDKLEKSSSPQNKEIETKTSEKTITNEQKLMIDATPLSMALTKFVDTNKEPMKFDFEKSQNQSKSLELKDPYKMMDSQKQDPIVLKEVLNEMKRSDIDAYDKIMKNLSLSQPLNSNFTNKPSLKLNNNVTPTDISFKQPNLTVNKKAEEVKVNPFDINLKISLEGTPGLELNEQHMKRIGESVASQIETSTVLQQAIIKATDNSTNASTNYGLTKKY
jgi:hypothetical protein